MYRCSSDSILHNDTSLRLLESRHVRGLKKRFCCFSDSKQKGLLNCWHSVMHSEYNRDENICILIRLDIQACPEPTTPHDRPEVVAIPCYLRHAPNTVHHSASKTMFSSHRGQCWWKKMTFCNEGRKCTAKQGRQMPVYQTLTQMIKRVRN